MKYLLLIITLIISNLAFAQSDFPNFLEGTWKMENNEIYENWDLLSDNSLKGFSYQIKDGQINVSEYLEIKQLNENVVYLANVINQNNGKPIDFQLNKTENTYSFENPNHDFPKKIVYQKLSDTEILVKVSGDHENGFEYKMQKQFQKSVTNESAISNSNYDHRLAEKLGGDDYGMKSYFLVILKTGSNTNSDKDFIAESFRGHLDNIKRLVEEGKLVVAGPMGKNENNYRGIFILNNIKTMEEANKILQTDPAINNELLDYDIFTWYGSAALPEYLPFAEKITKSNP